MTITLKVEATVEPTSHVFPVVTLSLSEWNALSWGFMFEDLSKRFGVPVVDFRLENDADAEVPH